MKKYLFSLLFLVGCSVPALKDEYYEIRPCPTNIVAEELIFHADIAYSSKEKQDIADAAKLWSKASCIYKIVPQFDCHKEYNDRMSINDNCFSGGKKYSFDPGTHGCSFRPMVLFSIGIKVLHLSKRDNGVLLYSCDRASNIQESDFVFCQQQGKCL